MEPAGSGNVCRHFLNGYCRFGPNCSFRHEFPVLPPSVVCRYFQKGNCWYGACCKYLHVLQPEVDALTAGRRGSVPSFFPSSSFSSFSSSSMVHAQPDRRGSVPALLQVGATPALVYNRSDGLIGISNNPDSGRLQENIAEEQTQDANLDSSEKSKVKQAGTSQVKNKDVAVPEVMEDGAASAIAGAADAPALITQSKAQVAEAYLRSKNVTCGICMDKVYEKPDPRNHVFGILPNCNHSYCLQCIKTWRKTKDFGKDVVKSCPECRLSSPYYVPTKYWVEGQAKESLIAAFKEKFSKKRCNYYTRYGCCPFKKDCLHSHDTPAAGHRHSLFATEEDDEEEDDFDSLDLMGLLLAMTFLGVDDDDDDDFEIPHFSIA